MYFGLFSLSLFHMSCIPFPLSFTTSCIILCVHMSVIQIFSTEGLPNGGTIILDLGGNGRQAIVLRNITITGRTCAVLPSPSDLLYLASLYIAGIHLSCCAMFWFNSLLLLTATLAANDVVCSPAQVPFQLQSLSKSAIQTF